MASTSSIEDVSKILVPSAVLEQLFGVKDRMIRELADRGILKRDSKGKYFLMESVKSYVIMLKASKGGRIITEDGELNLDEERAKHEFIKRQITEIKLQLIKGQVHKAEDVEAVMTDMLEKFKSKMISIPPRLATQMEGEDKLEIQRILTTEINEALMELSDYNPVDFYSDEHIEISDDAVMDLIDEVSDGSIQR